MSFLEGELRQALGQSIVLGVRPEALSLIPGGADALSFTGKVLLVEPLGDRVDVTLTLAGGGRLVARLDARQAVAEGEPMQLFVALDACHWFRPGPEGEALRIDPGAGSSFHMRQG